MNGENTNYETLATKCFGLSLNSSFGTSMRIPSGTGILQYLVDKTAFFSFLTVKNEKFGKVGKKRYVLQLICFMK